MKAIVLAGGGTRGAYQLGVWKALKKLNIKYEIVTGTSIGSFNGAFMVQNNFKKAKKVWGSVDYHLFFDEKVDITNKEIARLAYQNAVKDNSFFNLTPLNDLLEQYININKIYKSRINYGLVTYNISKLKGVELTKNEIKKEQLLDYINASCSCYPVVNPKVIDNDKYIDGGYADNMPISLAVKMGATEIIAVDLKSVGLIKKRKHNIPITIISPKNPLPTFLELNQENLKELIILGYNDTLKKFKRLDGAYFTFKKYHIDKTLTKFYLNYSRTLDVIISNKSLLKRINKTIDNYNFTAGKSFRNILESLGKSYNLDYTKIYSYKKFNKELISALYNSIENNDNNSLTKKYLLFKNNNFTFINSLITLHPNELIKLLYLHSIDYKGNK